MIDPTRCWKVYRYGNGRVDYMPSAVATTLDTVKDDLTLAEAIGLSDHLNAERSYCTCPQHGTWLAADDIHRMTRELDVAMNGDGAAQMPRLSDIYTQLLERIARPADGIPDATRAMTARVVAERVRQQTDEGRTPEWDDRHTTGGLARAAACYALSAARTDPQRDESGQRAVANCWPWDWSWWKPADPMRDLERAGALILAEMERLARS